MLMYSPKQCYTGKCWPNPHVRRAAGMTEEERASLEAMRAREHELESVLAAQEDTLNAHQRQVWEHQAARERMQAEWDALQGRVRPQGVLGIGSRLHGGFIGVLARSGSTRPPASACRPSGMRCRGGCGPRACLG